jgi:hypothetical protein
MNLVEDMGFSVFARLTRNLAGTFTRYILLSRSPFQNERLEIVWKFSDIATDSVEVPFVFAVNVNYMVRIRIVLNVIRFKIWDITLPEPDDCTWNTWMTILLLSVQVLTHLNLQAQTPNHILYIDNLLIESGIVPPILYTRVAQAQAFIRLPNRAQGQARALIINNKFLDRHKPMLGYEILTQ